MVSQDNRLLPPLSPTDHNLDRPLRHLTQPQPAAAGGGGAGTTFVSAQTHLRDYLSVVLKRRWLILSLMVVVTSLVALQMYRLPSIYRAETTIQIEPKKSILTQNKDAIVFSSAYRDAAYWNTQIRLLQNPRLARQVVLALDLQNNPAFLGGQGGTGLISAVRRVFSRDRPAAATEAGVGVVDESETSSESMTPEQLARLQPYEDVLLANLSIEPIEKTNLVVIRFTHANPEIAARVVNTLGDVFIYNDMQRETKGAGVASEKLAQEIAELQQKIRQGEEARLNYLRSHNLPLDKARKGGDLTAERLSTLSAQLLEAEHQRKNLQAAYDAAKKERNVAAIPEIQENRSVQRLQEKIEALETRRAELLEQYTEEWPEVKKIDKQIEFLTKERERIPQEVLTGMESRYAAASSKVDKLWKDYNRELGVANQQSQAEIALNNINQELETNKQFYNTLYQKLKEVQITSSDQSNNITIANPSRVPGAPIGPPRVRNIIIALFLSLGAGIGLAFLLDYLDDTLKSIEDVDRHIQLPTLALIPAPRSERRLLKGRGQAAAAAAEGPANATTALALVSDVRSPVAEAYRHLRTSLLLSSAGQAPKTVLVTSSQPSEGKTTTAVNTAMMLAQTSAEVLIVDCDLRRPRIHTHFGLPNSRGLTNYLSGEADLDSLLLPYDKQPNLRVLASGPIPPNPAELLGSDEMRKLLNQLSARFTHIVIDSPPAISFTDASLLSTLVDGVVLVVHGGRSSRAVVQRAKQQLLDVGANIFGIVLNNVRLDAHNNYYMYGGYYSSYYANDDEDGAADEMGGAAATTGRGGGVSG